MVKRRSGRRLLAGTLLALAAVLVPAGRAEAHIELVPTLVNRYLTLVARGEQLHVQLSLLWGELPALEERRRMDLDGDGRLDQGELNRARRAFTRRAQEMLVLRRDGEPVRFAPSAAISTSGKDSVTTAPLLLELTAVLELPTATRRLEVSLGPDLPRMGESEVVLELDPDWRLTGSELPAGQKTASVESRFKFASARSAGDQSRQVAFELQHQPGGKARDRGVWLLGLLVGAAVLSALGLAAWRWRRARDPRG